MMKIRNGLVILVGILMIFGIMPQFGRSVTNPSMYPSGPTKPVPYNMTYDPDASQGSAPINNANKFGSGNGSILLQNGNMTLILSNNTPTPSPGLYFYFDIELVQKTSNFSMAFQTTVEYAGYNFSITFGFGDTSSGLMMNRTLLMNNLFTIYRFFDITSYIQPGNLMRVGYNLTDLIYQCFAYENLTTLERDITVQALKLTEDMIPPATPSSDRVLILGTFVNMRWWITNGTAMINLKSVGLSHTEIVAPSNGSVIVLGVCGIVAIPIVAIPLIRRRRR